MRVVELALEHEKALTEFLADFEQAGETHIPAFFGSEDWSHAKTVEEFSRQSRGEGLPAGWVPGTTYFLFEDDVIVGVANLRHRLNEKLLAFGGHVGYSVRPSARNRGCATALLGEIKKLAKERGIARLRVTCSADNTASARVIEKCGGTLDDQVYVEEAGGHVRRYWIDSA